jgi:hypothetical protein
LWASKQIWLAPHCNWVPEFGPGATLSLTLSFRKFLLLLAELELLDGGQSRPAWNLCSGLCRGVNSPASDQKLHWLLNWFSYSHNLHLHDICCLPCKLVKTKCYTAWLYRFISWMLLYLIF